MNTHKLALAVVLVAIALILLAGFLYLQAEITDLRNSGHPIQQASTPLPTATPNPAATPSPNYVVSSTESSTTTTNDGTTLVCNWTLGNNNPYAVVFLGNGSNSILDFDTITITNVGNATAYVSGVRFQTYSSNGTLLMDQTLPPYVPVNTFLPNPNPYETLLPSGSFGIDYTQTALEQNPALNELGSSVFATLILTPIWSNIPPSS